MIKEYLERQFANYHAVSSGYVTPEMFGAKGDGVTDDTQAFVTACDYAMSSGKRVVKLTKKYRLAQSVTIAGDKYLQLVIEGNAISGTNVEQARYLDKPINIIAEGGLIAGFYVHFKNVGFKDYGVTARGSRIRFEGCVFNKCNPAIRVLNTGDASAWIGEIFIDNCDFSLCPVSIDASVGENGGYVKDSRIFDCTAIRGDVFLKGKVSAWKIRGNHIYSSLPFSELSCGTMQIMDNYFDTNQIAVDITVRSDGICQFANNLFLKSTVTKDANEKANPVCKIVAQARAFVSFEGNTCTKNYDSSNQDEVFVNFSGDGTFNYSDNVCKIKFTNDDFTTKRGYSKDSNVIVMPKHTDRADLIRSGVLDKPIICLTFDGWKEEEVTELAPYLQQKGLPFTVFHGECDNTPNEPMTQSRLEAIHTIPNYGGELQFYTSQPHETFDGTKNYREQWTQLKSAYDRYLSWGFPKPKVCSLSGGSYSPILIKYLQELGIKCARAAVEDPNPNLNEESMLYGSFLVTGKNWQSKNWSVLDASVDPSWFNSNKPKIFTLHGLMEGDDSNSGANITKEHMLTFIDEVSNYVNTYGYTVMTFSELWDYIHFPRNAEVGQKALIWETDGQHEYIKTESGWRELTK